MGWWNRARAVNAFFADAVFVYRVTGDGPVRLAALAAAKEMSTSQRAAAVKFVRDVADDMREQRTAGGGSDGAAALLEQLASEISLRDWTIRDVVHDRRALADLDEELERALGSWLGYCDFAVFRRRFPSLWGETESRVGSRRSIPQRAIFYIRFAAGWGLPFLGLGHRSMRSCLEKGHLTVVVEVPSLPL